MKHQPCHSSGSELAVCWRSLLSSAPSPVMLGSVPVGAWHRVVLLSQGPWRHGQARNWDAALMYDPSCSAQFALMHASVHPENRSEDASPWHSHRVLQTRAQSRAQTSPCLWNWPHLEGFMEASLDMEKRQDIVQSMPLTGSPPPLKTFHLKKEKYQLEL